MSVEVPIEEIDLDLVVDLEKEIPCFSEGCNETAIWSCGHGVPTCRILLCPKHKLMLEISVEIHRMENRKFSCRKCGSWAFPPEDVECFLL